MINHRAFQTLYARKLAAEQITKHDVKYNLYYIVTDNNIKHAISIWHLAVLRQASLTVI